ncbi:hypothetical protein ACFQRG_11370 [Scopulibacillus cellulosilyticus]|uniref:Uncharacterized protein n=2 Tax=Scopulibacillus cellulosilyticus TaxID=2665665 RepID=A0ABW2PVZ8_9BACL
MMDYQYRRKAYELLSQQREDVLKELKEEYLKKKPDHIDRFFKGCRAAFSSFFHFF